MPRHIASAIVVTVLSSLVPAATATADAEGPPTGRCVVITRNGAPGACESARPAHENDGVVWLHTYGLGHREAMTVELFDADAEGSEALVACTLRNGGNYYDACSSTEVVPAHVTNLRCVVTPARGTKALGAATCTAP